MGCLGFDFPFYQLTDAGLIVLRCLREFFHPKQRQRDKEKDDSKTTKEEITERERFLGRLADRQDT